MKNVMTFASLCIGVNRAPRARSLRYAESDAVRTHRLLTGNLGPGTTADSQVLIGRSATRPEVRAALGRIRQQSPDYVVIFASGHGGPSGFVLADGLFEYGEFADRLAQIGAVRPVVILDACHAGAAIRPLRVHIGGVGGLDVDLAEEWRATVAASTPGLRVYAAVAEGETTVDDPEVAAGRFSWCLRRALRFGKGRRFGRHHWVTASDAFRSAALDMAQAWPEDAAPIFLSPRYDADHLPLVLAQSAQAIGSACVASAVVGRGTELIVSVATRSRQFVPTYVSARAFDTDGQLLAHERRQISPRAPHDMIAAGFSVGLPRLETSAIAMACMLLNEPITLYWELSVHDDFGRVFDSQSLMGAHWVASSRTG